MPAPKSPLRPAVFQVLLVLSHGALHGYGVMQALRALGRDAEQLETGPLYRHLHRMLEDGLIAQIDKPEPGADPRRRTYRLTPLGRRALAGETRRLARLVGYASDPSSMLRPREA